MYIAHTRQGYTSIYSGGEKIGRNAKCNFLTVVMAIRLLTGNLYAIDQSCIYHLLAFRILFLQHNNHHKILVTAYTYLHMRTASILTSFYAHIQHKTLCSLFAEDIHDCRDNTYMS